MNKCNGNLTNGRRDTRRQHSPKVIKMSVALPQRHAHFISCSNPLKMSQLKKSIIVMLRPSHSFFTVETVALLFLPLVMLLIVDCVTPLIVPSLLTVISLSRHSSIIRSFTALPMVIKSPPNQNELIILWQKSLKLINSFELTTSSADDTINSIWLIGAMAMKSTDRFILVRQAARLTALGVAVERERSNLRKLVECGVLYNDPRMMQAYERFVRADNEWKRLESEHLRLRKKLGMDSI